MSFLTPLYITGLLAIALPVLFHLIRRTPQGKQTFSSLMFLTPSPPRITRKSRLSNILLLILRAGALALLAFAFARPFLRQDASANVTEAAGRRVAVLVDTSASMRRADLWQQAKAQVEEVLADAKPGDEVALYLFDRTVRPAVTFKQWGELDAPRRAELVRAAMGAAGPTWAGTRLGDALAAAADALAETDAADGGAKPTARQVVLISDLQQGSHAEALQGHPWPESVRVEVKPVVASGTTNAGVQWVERSPENAADARVPVRVVNQPDSKREQFKLAWANAAGPLADVPAVPVYVPPGRTHVARLPLPPAGSGADRLVLGGDDHDFDNTVYVVPPRKETVRVAFFGDDAADDTKGLLYYLQSAVTDTPMRTVELVVRTSGDAINAGDLLDARLAVAAAPMPDDRAAALRRFAEAGGDVLVVLKDTSAHSAVERLTGFAGVRISEGAAKDFALLTRITADHPLFAPFAEARFADFTKIHFWKHRKVEFANGAGAPRVVAAFDDGDPFLLEQNVGKGRVLIATSGWHPADSQLALSTKFVPMVNALLRSRGPGTGQTQLTVFDPMALPATEGDAAVVKPDGTRMQLSAGAKVFDGADQPGIYRVAMQGQEIPVAVNLTGDESRTAPMAVEELEHFGARLGTRETPEEVATRQRQLQVIELEDRQKLWRWLVVGVLALVAAETFLAGRLARRDASAAAGEPGPGEMVPQQVTA